MSEPTVVSCKDRTTIVDSLLSDLDNFFEKSPVVVIIPDDERAKIIGHMRVNK